MPTPALVVYLCLTLGFFHFFWGGTLRIAPIVHRDEVTVLTIETIGKPYKAGIVHWMFAEVSPWQGVDATQRLQILDRDWMDRLEIGQTIELGWASVWKVRVIKTIEAVDRYLGAPAMQVAHRSHVVKMLDADALAALVAEEDPALIVPDADRR
ncbi:MULTISPECIES: hypothetical protein [unclassified Thiocapsa]|uniref:hypothetical protein n=1 Tax=unclassified Thiocapsa TaxID=2641286 RepID=UPI0035B28A66